MAVPLGWLLSFAALLPFFLGLFFFALFGLVIGAAVYRVAAPGRPFGRAVVLGGATFLVLFTWAVSFLVEAWGFPHDMAERALPDARLDLMEMTPAEYKATVTHQVSEFLREHYPPGGILGYLRWVVVRGEFSRDDLPASHKAYVFSQPRHWWLIRVALSIGLLAFGIGSQTFALRSATRASAGAAPAEIG